MPDFTPNVPSPTSLYPRPDAPSTAQGVLSAPNPQLMQLRQPYIAGRPQPVFPLPQPGQGTPALPPAPTHAQTIAGLRHFTTIERGLERLLREPELGKQDMRAKIVDGLADLVADRMMTPGSAVEELGGLPERPFDQRTWLQQHLLNVQQAQIAVLAHHAQAFGGLPEEALDRRSDPSDHLAHMQALHQQYGGRRA